MKKGVAWLRKFLLWMQNKKMRSFKNSIAVSELQAECSIVRCVQKNVFAKEVTAMQSSKKIPKSSSIHALEPLLDGHNILCVGCRLASAPIQFERKHPMILPRSHHVSELVIKHLHETTVHAGTEYVLSHLSGRYWIPKARPSIKQMQRNCVACKRRDCKPEAQRMADLPSDRTTPGNSPFTLCRR